MRAIAELRSRAGLMHSSSSKTTHARIGVHARDLRRLELEGEIPPGIRIGRRVRWRRRSLEAWLSRLEKKALDAGARGRLHVRAVNDHTAAHQEPEG